MRHEFVNLQPVPISAGPANTVRSTIEVAGLGDARTEDIEVTVNITHTWAADLVISLRAPDGGEVILDEREGASGDDFRNTIFRSNAQTAIKGARAPFRGTFRPEGDLASLFGKRAQGAWTLVVADKANRDGGALNRWSLGLTTNATPASEFQVRVRFLGGLSPAQQAAFAGAAARWSKIITGDVPPVVLDGEEIDDVLIEAQGVAIDGPGRVLGQAGPTFIRPSSRIPIKGLMSFDTADLDRMEANGSLQDVILHEMAHVLGFGTLWSAMRLIVGAGTVNPIFVGANAMREYAALTGRSEPTAVPVANVGGPGTRDGHWREEVFGDELLTGFLSGAVRPLSRMSIGAFEDMGYRIDYEAADAFVMPSALRLAEMGIHGDRHDEDTCAIARTVPVVVPESAMVNRLR